MARGRNITKTKRTRRCARGPLDRQQFHFLPLALSVFGGAHSFALRSQKGRKIGWRIQGGPTPTLVPQKQPSRKYSSTVTTRPREPSDVVSLFKNSRFAQSLSDKGAFELFTVAADWSLFFVTAIIAQCLAKNAITAVFAVWILYGLLFAREYIYMKHFDNDYIPKEKQALPKDSFRYALSTVGMISIHTFICAETSWISLGTLALKDLFTSWVHYIAGGLVWDVCAFQFIHRRMHHRRFYFLHKPHHVGVKDCNAFSGQSFDVRDLIPSFAFSTCSMILFGKGNVHLMTLLITMIAANNNHSCNPFSVIMFNPILDKVFRVNVSHQCHHARPSDKEHMGNLPIHHLVRSLRKENIEKYDNIFQTNISNKLVSVN